jgi:predicted DNA-binding ribbon-helix-helix protein
MAKQGRSQGGKFAPKSEEPRSVRTMRLTDAAWEKLGEIADSRGITRADLIEEWVEQPASEQVRQLAIFDEHLVNITSEERINLQEIEAAIAHILDDPVITRKGKDRSSIKRALQALHDLFS